MQIIKASHEHMPHDIPPVQFIEKVGRTCYKSEDKITENSAEKFVTGLIKHGHMAMLEHETIFLSMNPARVKMMISEIYGMKKSPSFLNISTNIEPNIVSGSFRSFYDLFFAYLNKKEKVDTKSTLMHIARLLHMEFPSIFPEHLGQDSACMPEVDDMDVFLSVNHVISRENFVKTYQTHPDVIKKHLTHTVKFTCDRGVTHELVRHRVCSFAQESTRYCNYANGKFGNEITVIQPLFFQEGSEEYSIWKAGCEQAEQAYFALTQKGCSAEKARTVLPNSLKADIIMTATEEEWQHIINLRAKDVTGKAHPQMKEIMVPWMEELKKITKNRIF